MKILTAADILAAPDIKTYEVEVPEWGGVVLLRPMSGYQRDQWETQFAGIDRKKDPKATEKLLVNFRARLVAAHAVDENGSLLFMPKQVEALGQKSAAALDRLFTKCQEISGLSEADVKELEENLEQAQGDNSGLD